MNSEQTFHNAKQLYLEQYGDPMVTNTYLKIALVLVCLVSAGLALVDSPLCAASSMRLVRLHAAF